MPKEITVDRRRLLKTTSVALTGLAGLTAAGSVSAESCNTVGYYSGGTTIRVKPEECYGGPLRVYDGSSFDNHIDTVPNLISGDVANTGSGDGTRFSRVEWNANNYTDGWMWNGHIEEHPYLD